ncbi:Uncharacterised protein [Bordetella pertussis]|nr:Uncharacterised protein [Bordetella pertussis]
MPGLAFRCAIRPWTSRTGDDGLTTTSSGLDATAAIGSKLPVALYGRLA